MRVKTKTLDLSAGSLGSYQDIAGETGSLTLAFKINTFLIWVDLFTSAIRNERKVQVGRAKSTMKMLHMKEPIQCSLLNEIFLSFFESLNIFSSCYVVIRRNSFHWVWILNYLIVRMVSNRNQWESGHLKILTSIQWLALII